MQRFEMRSFIVPVIGAVGLAVAVVAGLDVASAHEEPFIIPAPATTITEATGLQTAVFGAGCFWGVQAVFQHVEGVTEAVSGYAGGTAETADYRLVSTGRTEHAEVVEVTYDPEVIGYGELLHILFSVVHDPTQLNYQGPDHGPQYRSAIFPVTAEQEEMARAYIGQLDATGVYGAPVVTTIEDLTAFHPAETYHQDFLALNPSHPYIVRWDLPKLVNLKAVFPDHYREDPELVLS